MDSIVWAYLAGLFDGEGSVFAGLKKNKKGSTPWFRLVVTINNTDKETLDWVKDTLGYGYYSEFKGTKPQHKTGYILYVPSVNQLDFMFGVLPYARIKQERLKVAIQLRELMGGWYNAPEKLELVNQLKSLNAKGRSKLG